MIQITVEVEGMQCGMCEAHVNDAIRNALKVKKVTSSHTKGRTVILTENDIDEQAIKDLIEKSGYKAISVNKTAYEKKGLFSGFRR